MAQQTTMTNHVKEPPQYVVYTFTQSDYHNAGYVSKSLPLGMKRLNWTRDSVNDDLANALTRAEMALQNDQVKRVQIFEQKIDTDGQYRIGRMVRHYGTRWWHALLGMNR